jgi:hypothetical protein
MGVGLILGAHEQHGELTVGVEDRAGDRHVVREPVDERGMLIPSWLLTPRGAGGQSRLT